MNLTETDFLLTITTFIILIVILMMVLVYGVFVKKKIRTFTFTTKKRSAVRAGIGDFSGGN